MRTRLERGRLGAALLAAWGVVIGVAPHVLHHVGPLAGAAFLAGAGGKLVFAALGLALSIPFLRKLYRRFQTLAAPVLAVWAFIGIFTISSLVVSPLITGGSDSGKAPGGQVPAGHASHHDN